MDLQSLFNHSLHLYQVSRKHRERFQSNGADTISILIITMGYNSLDIVHGVTVVVLCTLSDYSHICTKFHGNILAVSDLWIGLNFIIYYYKGTFRSPKQRKFETKVLNILALEDKIWILLNFYSIFIQY